MGFEKIGGVQCFFQTFCDLDIFPFCASFSLFLCFWSSKSHYRPPLSGVTILMPTHIFVFNHELNSIKSFYMAQHKTSFKSFV
jgi:hypothetical protein